MLQRVFAIDLRSLALLRIALSLLLIADLCNRARSLVGHYTDFGVLPRTVLLADLTPAASWSFHLISGSYAFQLLLFLLAGLFAFALLFGVRSRLMTVLSWLMLVSLHVRNPLVLQGGDLVLRMLLFWSMFLPLGARFSLDSNANPEASARTLRICCVASAALLLQICLVYWCTVVYKWNEVWLTGQGVHYALRIDQFATPLGRWLLNFPGLVTFLSYVVLFVEFVIPLSAFSLWKTQIIRVFVVFAMIGMHLSFGLCLELGIFPYVSAASWLPFLPTLFWEHAQKAYKRSSSAVHQYLHRSIDLLQTAANALPVRRQREDPLFIENAIAAVFLLAVILWNVQGYNYERFSAHFPKLLNTLAYSVRIDQQWNMFTRPLRYDGWYVIHGKLKDGTDVDVFRNGAQVSWDRPALISAMYTNHRWRKYMMNLFMQRHETQRLHYGRYLCRSWNKEHDADKQLDTFKLFYMREKTLMDYRETPPKKLLLWRHYCLSEPKEWW